MSPRNLPSVPTAAPSSTAERTDLLAYYHQDRTQNQSSREEALRTLITSVLMEPDFLYRLDMARRTPPP